MKKIYSLISVLSLSLFFQTGTLLAQGEIKFTPDQKEGCAPLAVHFNNESTVGDTYQWYVDNEFVFEGQHLNYTFMKAGYHHVRMEARQGFSYLGDFYQDIMVFGADTFFISSGSKACPGEEIFFELRGDHNWIKWDFGDGNTADYNYTPHTYSSAGNYDVTMTVGAECGVHVVTQTLEVTTTALPIVEGYANTHSVCPEDAVSFWSQYEAQSYSWDFDDGHTSTERNPVYVFSTLGSKAVTLTVTNLCGNTNTDTIYVQVEGGIMADANFGFSYPACPNGLVQFYAHNSGNYTWNLGSAGTSSTKDPQVMFTDTGHYQVELIVTNGCGSVDTRTEDVHIKYDPTIKPWVDISFEDEDWSKDTIMICPGEDVSIKNNSYSDAKLEYLWDFGDGKTSTDKNGEHTFTNAGIFTVKLTVSNNCMGQDSAMKWVVVNPNAQPLADLQILQDTICPGEKLFFIDDDRNLRERNYSYSIWYGDGGNLLNATSFPDPDIPVFYHEYPNLGSYDYTFEVKNVCGNTESLSGTIVVSDSPNFEPFYYVANSTSEGNGDDDAGCPGDPVSFMVFGGDTYEWHFGDGSISTDQFPLNTYPDTGQYSAYVLATNGCGRIDTLFTTVSIEDSVFADTWFNIEGDKICANDTTFFRYHRDEDDDKTAHYEFNWNFGDGNFSTERNPKHVYETGGEFVVSLAVTNGCGTDSTFRFIQVNSPVVDFSVSSINVGVGSSVMFTNNTSFANEYYWEFGDETTSSAQNPTHAYVSPNDYTVSLTATNTLGCSSKLTKDDLIHVHNFEIAEELVHDISCQGKQDGAISLGVSGGEYPYTYVWERETYGILPFEGSVIDGLGAGNYHVTITDEYGVSITEIYVLNTPPLFGASVSKNDVSCYGYDNGNSTITPIGGTAPYTYHWLNGETTQTINDLSPDDYKVFAKDARGCETSKLNITINDAPQIGYFFNPIINPDCGVNNGSITVNGSGGGGAPYSYKWSTGETGIMAKNLVAGSYEVTITDSKGCKEKAIAILNNNSAPSAWIDHMKEVSCSGQNDGEANVFAGGVAPITYEWSHGATGAFQNNLAGGDYVITVADGNACKVIVDLTINEPKPLAVRFNAIDPTCAGGYDGFVKAISSGGNFGHYYQWSNGSYKDSIINRPAGTYTVTVSDWAGCELVESVTLSDPLELNVQMYASDITFYGANNGFVSTLVENGVPPYIYEWSNEAASESIGSLPAGEYTVTVVDANGCTANSSVIIKEPDPLVVNITASGATTFCYGNSVTLDAGDEYLSYNWSTGETTRQITVDETDTYYVTVTNENSFGVDSMVINSIEPYADQEVCLVTIDTATNKNLIVWEKSYDEGIVMYNIYKETTSADVYNQIGSVPFGEVSVFLDENSNPAQKSARYKISIVDTCGNESDLSEVHKTMHLTVSTGIGVYNLIWENYEGFEFGSYLIYRGTSPDDLLPIGAIQSNLTTYTDYQPIGLYYYQIAILKPDACYPANGFAKLNTGPYSQSVSNLEDNGIIPDIIIPIDTTDNDDTLTAIRTIQKVENLKIYPNPFTETTTIEFHNPDNSNYQVYITDITGKVVGREEGISTNKVKIDKGSLKPGLYFIELRGERTYRGRIVVK